MNQNAFKFSVTDYLERIDCPLEIKPTPTYLKKLHRQHLFHIPFENLDHFLGNQIILDHTRIYNKIVLGKRGGFCYELNGLFYLLLKKLGFDVRIVSSRPFDKKGNLKPEFDHMALLVYFEDETYLADVGYGLSFKNPLLLKPGLLQMDYNLYYRIEKDIDEVYTLQHSHDTVTFKNEFTFTEIDRKMVEFIDMCDFHSQNKASHLTRSRVACISNKTGYIYLTDKLLTVRQNGKSEEINIHNLDEFKVKLLEYFGIVYGTRF